MSHATENSNIQNAVLKTNDTIELENLQKDIVLVYFMPDNNENLAGLVNRDFRIL